MDHSISLIELFTIIRKRWRIILLMTMGAALISSIISFFLLTPVYQASTQMLVNQKNMESSLDYNQMRSNVDIINTYSGIIKSPAILEKVIEKLDLTQSVEQINQNIEINSQENSQIFSLTVEDSDAGRAVVIANSISQTFQEEIEGIMSVDNVSILADAELKDNPTPVKPKPLLNTVIGLVIGFIVGLGITLLLEVMDSTLKDEKDVAALLGVPILGSVQKLPQENIKGDKSPNYKKKMEGETFVS